jgi:tetratricopeptide (TPR) repeat protein
MWRSRWLRLIGLGVLLALGGSTLALGVGHWRLERRVAEGRRLVRAAAYLPAARALLRAVAQAPDDAGVHYTLGLAYAGMGRTESARIELEDAVRLAPGEIRYRVGLAGLLLDQGRVTKALAQLERVTRSRPRAVDVRLLLAETLRRAGDQAAMEREYREVIRQAGDTALGALARERLRATATTARP